MMLLLTVVICFFLFVWILIYAEEYENKKRDAALDNFKKRWKQEMMVRYRVYITHATGSVRVRTISGDNFSEVMDDALEQAIREENSFPDKIIIREDIIYL
ncbi:MAG: hypothetical protein E3J47_08230 [Candidatus Stahlbacteria bacterium]|nr:MAG: hypothetical protein E3J47_08230 [Candidatus Stahlbacteria bacterium]